MTLLPPEFAAVTGPGGRGILDAQWIRGRWERPWMDGVAVVGCHASVPLEGHDLWIKVALMPVARLDRVTAGLSDVGTLLGYGETTDRDVGRL